MKITYPATANYDELMDEINQFWCPLADKPEETPHGLLCSLWHTAAGVPVSAERAPKMALPPLLHDTHNRLRSLLRLKKSGVPLAHLTQRQYFLGLELLSGPDALIPRKETEILGRAVLGKLKSLTEERGQLSVMDLCTGSGNLALAYAHHENTVLVYGSDISGEAVALAKRNAAYLGLERRVGFFEGDLFAPFESDVPCKYDLLSCNPPYIATANVPKMHPEISRFEPAVAFNGGHYGNAVVSKLIRHAPRFLKPSSWLAFEVGLGTGRLFAKQLQMNPAFCAVETYNDSAGNIRALLAKTHPEN